MFFVETVMHFSGFFFISNSKDINVALMCPYWIKVFIFFK